MLRRRRLAPWLLAVLFAAPGWAQEAAAPQTAYVNLDPAFVTNFGGAGKLRFMKVDVSLRVSDAALGESAIRHHMPAIRDAMVMLLSRQEESLIGTSEGKELLRQEALKAVQTVIEREEGETYVTDLLFNSFIVQ